ncbi:PREDICTED: angiotensin-converting enzyme-like [Papilio polytes]|uniref:angiotensin-converting enzyme-like n=1 Tax=Papilio polytes TaxID=76194 RepID=UPI000676A7DF|nr:PREDICTED: angiotensin-converting enzyme-like [Papilio polytes]
MKIKLAIFILYLLKVCNCVHIVYNLFEEINNDVVKFNAIAADIEWNSSVNPTPGLQERSLLYLKRRITWQRKTCNKLTAIKNILTNGTQQRQSFLFCRGPTYNLEEASFLNKLNEKMLSIYYNAQVCIPKKTSHEKSATTNVAKERRIKEYLLKYDKENVNKDNILQRTEKEEALCLKQKDLEELIENSNDEKVLKWIWKMWRQKTGPLIKEYFKTAVNIENRAARRNGYQDIGVSWREELEVSDLRGYCQQLYQSVKPLYTLLHGVVRYFLRKKHGDIIPARGPIPAHLLGNLWLQNWESLSDLIIPNSINLDDSMKNKKWDVKHMIKRTEDFYLSLGLPPMTDAFWRKSIFMADDNKIRCHGTAANMFKDDDYRLLYCSGVSFKDFVVLHHEMGHIQYYMAYVNQPGIFRQANSAFHESIGDAITIGVTTPQHLNRLSLINDSTLYSAYTNFKDHSQAVSNASNKEKEFSSSIVTNKSETIQFSNATTDEILLLKRALNKLPQIPFSLLIDKYRWKYFENGIDEASMNKEFWAMSLELQGISPPEERSEDFFDIGAIYHVADNTPYIRYFLASFFQHQVFEHLCKVAVFGKHGDARELPKSIPMNRCDIYGSKASGKLLKKFMSLGNSHHWREILQETFNEHDISAAALLRYYRPLEDYLVRLVKEHNIPLGW